VAKGEQDTYEVWAQKAALNAETKQRDWVRIIDPAKDNGGVFENPNDALAAANVAADQPDNWEVVVVKRIPYLRLNAVGKTRVTREELDGDEPASKEPKPKREWRSPTEI